MFNKVLCCLAVMLIGMSKANAGLLSVCIYETPEDLYKTGVEEGGDITITHLVFAAAASPELVNASCDFVVNYDAKTLKILPCEGNCLEEKRFSLIARWIAETLGDVAEYEWIMM